jgi:hypothetical protein
MEHHHRQLLLAEAAELLASDKAAGKTLGVGEEERRVKAQQVATEKKHTMETEKREAAAAQATKDERLMIQLG